MGIREKPRGPFICLHSAITVKCGQAMEIAVSLIWNHLVYYFVNELWRDVLDYEDRMVPLNSSTFPSFSLFTDCDQPLSCP